jgi:uncharacterized protein (DUF1499 family)
MQHIKSITRKLLISVSLVSVTLLLTACSGSRPIHLGEPLTSLMPCPDSPNCVSSNALAEDDHYIAPIASKGASLTQVQEKLITLIETDPAAEIIVNSAKYIYAEYTSAWMKYVDDVEFLIDETNQRIEVRSASRLGYSDFEVNRDRIESIREQLNQTK